MALKRIIVTVIVSILGLSSIMLESSGISLIDSIPQAYAATEEITSLSTDKQLYVKGELVTISGTVSPALIGVPVVIFVTDPDGNLIIISQNAVGAGGTFSLQAITLGPLWDVFGAYEVRAAYASASSVRTTFLLEETDETFTAVQNGDWNDPDTWGGVVPGVGNDKIIPIGITVDITGDLNNYGIIDNFGTINNNAGPSDTLLNLGTINNGGIININSTFEIEFENGFGGTLNNNIGGILNNNGEINNEGGGTLNNNDGGTINNNADGTIKNDASGIINNYADINNSGNIIIRTALNTSVTGVGSFNNYANIFNFNSITILNSGVINNYGKINNELEEPINPEIKPTINNNNGGTINNDGEINNEFRGIIENNNGSTFNNNSEGTVNINSNSGGIKNESGSVFNNYGNVNMYGGGLNNESDAIINNYGDIDTYAGDIDSYPGDIDNQGGVFNNYGKIDVGGLFENSGTLTNHEIGEINLSPDATIENWGGTLINIGTINNSGEIDNDSAVLHNFGDIINYGKISNFDPIIRNFGFLDNLGIIENSGILDNDGGTLNNAGSFDNMCPGIFRQSGTFSGNPIMNTCRLTVTSEFGTNNPILGYYAVLKQDGLIIETAFTPVTFIVNTDETYRLQVHSFEDFRFANWRDTGSTVPIRDFTLSANAHFIAEYRNINDPPADTSELIVRTVNSSGDEITGYWAVLLQDGAILQAGYSPMTFQLNDDEDYEIEMSSYQGVNFDHFEDGSEENPYLISINENTDVIVYYLP